MDPASPTRPSIRDWAATIASVLTLLMFAAGLLIAYRAGDEKNMTLMIGAIIAHTGTVVNFWLGSSAGSQKKSDDLTAIAAQPSTVVNNAPAPATP